MTYRYRYLTSLQLAPVLDLLLIDETNPRSVGFQLIALADHVRQPSQPERRSALERAVADHADRAGHVADRPTWRPWPQPGERRRPPLVGLALGPGDDPVVAALARALRTRISRTPARRGSWARFRRADMA